MIDRLSAELVTELAAAAPRISVIGDLIVDGWWDGHAERLSREAPAPVVEIADRSFAPGGAANTAAGLAALGARVRMIGIIGADDHGAILRRLLEERGIDTSHLIESDEAATIAKNRIVSGDQVLVRLDDGTRDGFTERDRDAVVAAAEDSATWAEAEVICDYACGTLAGDVLERLAARDRRPRPCVVDAHDLRDVSVLEPDIITPNAEEFALVCGDFEGDRADWAVRHRRELLEATGARAAVVTLDREGSVAFSAEGGAHRTYAHPTFERRASGAGDTFTSGLALALTCGVPLEIAVELAQTAADVVVMSEGTTVCSARDLHARLAPTDDSVFDVDELADAVSRHRADGLRIVFTNGCFDVVHRGHTASLRQAKQLGDILIVAINDDDSVRRLKGPDRPVNGAADRAAVLAALECVDYVTVFASDTPIPLVERLTPDVYAKGGDYMPEMLAETTVVEGYGGVVHVLDYVDAHSTSGIVQQIRRGRPAPVSGGE